jgi:tetratricopeptide (TPR) repeat protein
MSAVYAQTDSAKTYFQKGLTEKAAGRYMLASQAFNTAIAFDPEYEDARMQDAYVNLAMRRMDNAKAGFQKVYDMDHNNQEAIKALTDLYYDYHQYKLAINFAGMCKTCNNAPRIIAMSNFQEENYEDAVDQLTKVLQNDPKDAEVAYAIGSCYLELQDDIQAVQYFQKAVQLDPAKNEWTYELGLLYYNNQDYKDAVIAFDKAAADGYNDQSSDFKENLGFACVYSGSFARGEKLLLGLLTQRPENKDLLRGIADAYYSHKMYDQSLAFCQKLIMLDANDGMALYQAGMCFQKKGQAAKGQALCDKAIQLDPSLAALKQKQFSQGL